MEIWQTPAVIEYSQYLLNSFQKHVGRPLIEHLSPDSVQQAKQLFDAPYVVVSHGTHPDPLLIYGNQTALTLWEMEWSQLLQTPSRLTAEPVHREERARLLQLTTQNGYIDDYTGIRISSKGKRFQIQQAIVWNVLDTHGLLCGQAATFSHWSFLS